MKRFFLILALTVGTLALESTAEADDFSQEFSYDQIDKPMPKWSVGIGFDYRLDNPEYHEYVPSECIRVFYRLVSTLQLRFGMLHNSFTRLSSRTSYHTVAADLSLKLRFDHRWLSPYIESGIWMPFYWGIDDGRKYDDDHPGVRVAAGMSLQLSRKISLEAGVSQALNYIDQETDLMAPMPPLGSYHYHREAPTGAYNEARFEAGLVIAL